jgi:hypothetical protein
MTTNLNLASIKSTIGTTTSRTLGARFSDVKNVLDFGADPTGGADSKSAIQAAVDYATTPYSSANRGIIFFPAGTYLLNSSVTFHDSTGNRAIAFIGAPGAKLTGSVADALLKREVDSPASGDYLIQDLILENSNAAGKGIMLHSTIGAKVARCYISAFIGVETYNSQAITIENCSISPGGLGGTSIGVMAGNGTSVINCDITGMGEGIRHYNAGLVVLGGRYEVNGVGIRLGIDETGSSNGSSGFFLSGLSMESNGTAVRVDSGHTGFMSFGCGAGQAGKAYGLHILDGSDILVAGTACNSGPGFTNFGIAMDGGTRITFVSCSADSWDFAASGSPQSYQLIDCNAEVTVAQLPIAAPVGTILPVSNATATTVGSTVAGGGTNHVAVVRSAGVWRII